MRAKTTCGTAQYVAPEVINGNEKILLIILNVLETQYGKEVDYWSLGCIIYELLSGKLPFDSENGNQDEIFEAILKVESEYLNNYKLNRQKQIFRLISREKLMT